MMSEEHTTQPPSNTDTNRWRHPLLLRVYALILIGALLATWAAVRSDWIIGRYVAAEVTKVEAQLGGSLSYSAVSPAGMTGVELHDVVYRPANRDVVISIDAVRLYPSLRALLGRQLALSEVLLTNLTVSGSIDQPATLATGESASIGSGPCAVLDRLRGAVRVEGGTVDLAIAERSLPITTLTNLTITHECSPHGPSVYVDGLVAIDRSPVQVTAQIEAGGASMATAEFQTRSDIGPYLAPFVDLPAGAELFLGSVSVQSDGPITLGDIEAIGLNAQVPLLERWRLDAIRADLVTVQRVGERSMVVLDQASVRMAGLLEVTDLAVHQASFWWQDDLAVADGFLIMGDDSGTMTVDLSRSSYAENVTLTAAADNYSVAALARLLPNTEDVLIDEGRLSGRFSAVLSGMNSVVLDAEATIVDGGLSAPMIAARPLRGIDLTTETTLEVNLVTRTARLHQSHIQAGDVPFSLEGTLSWPAGGGRVEGRIACDAVDAQNLADALPRGLAPSLDDTEFSGSLSFGLDLDLDLANPDLSGVAVQLDMDDVDVERYGPQSDLSQLSREFAIRLGDEGVTREFGPMTDNWVGLEELSPYIPAALVNSEDGRFWTHDGFDRGAIQSSLEENLRRRRIVRGGSTITQQVARSLFLGQERTLGRKFEEAVLTWQLEDRLSKERIIELYLNVVHWGPGIHGITEAAEAYFSDEPENLTLTESVFLAAILSNPNVFGSQYAQGIVPPTRQEKICNILLNMERSALIARRESERACNQAMTGEISESPRPTHLVSPSLQLVHSISAQLQ